MDNIGGRIKHIRKFNKMIQTDFATLIGTVQGTLSEIEKGKLKPSVDTLYDIRKRFQIDLNWLVLGAIESSELLVFEYELIRKTRELGANSQKEVMEFIYFKLNRNRVSTSKTN
ncbi:helix-turn-helix transcriptional regulator [Brevibacillus sp. HB1.1]|uniref:helix-turn-helix domain-containing protein n=1 Tax=Brevibacillus sp. HB1.1 TaxID=2738808 RepID=UPI0015759287|nr:helix-turn-helix transcriptional regulator [Brevibacillus sp. HB1.1]NTU33226.1 helix-turn-helix transcriptional regulator [Brevibacillus sp. HB1.1]